ncbi:MAG: bifunctional phosphoribosylaminoimidazolecarboxamide formyltransferase/IMP cyclohydrolase [Nitrospirae bacterium RIFCSPLOW2_12_42_9]|nr:MAG: bifunctional phosphoribosylaminoimidazolecarboxamide formyltransferase/IMP cyclohydrolase [Nitrospirae bacterium RIFCSPLOW2_12_42_9]
MVQIKRAIISLSNKSGIVNFAKKLSEMGVSILSTGGTAKVLKEAGINVTDISAYTGFPEMMDGRVKTLHPKVHGGILGRRDNEEHMKQMKGADIEPIDMVVINLYPFEAVTSRPDCTFEEAIENIDIGGPSMVRSAAKNFEFVAVVTDPSDYSAILKEMEGSGGTLSRETRFRLARKAFATTARYDLLISHYLEDAATKKEESIHFPEIYTPVFEKVQHLRYGENPHQRGAFYRELGYNGAAISRARVLQGKEMSYNNYLDANSALELVREYDEPSTVIIKHNNPCGVASADDLKDSYCMARDTDPVSAFGGVIAFNTLVDEYTAEEVLKMFVEVIVAPEYTEEALKLFQKKGNVRLLEVGPLDAIPEGYMDFKRVVGGVLLQDMDQGINGDLNNLKVVSSRQPTEEEIESMRFSWRVCKHVRSNAIVFGRGKQTIGIGAGQMSRVDSVKLAISKARTDVRGCVMASDAFFPFRDAIDEAAGVGITAIIQPGGSIKDHDVIKAIDEYKMAMVFTGVRHFRH